MASDMSNIYLLYLNKSNYLQSYMTQNYGARKIHAFLASTIFTERNNNQKMLKLKQYNK